jgi:Domain of unknown function (DUF4331)
MSTGRGLFRRIALPASLVAAAIVALPFATSASSHREAPGITKKPKVDGTDFYMFRSYEAGREGFVTLVADYLPLQDPYGGPNYFTLDPDARYEIKVDNDGDAREDITFRFRFRNQSRNIALPIGAPGKQVSVPVPVINVGPISAGDNSALNVVESYTVEIVRGADKRFLRNAATGEARFEKPVDNIGNKSLPDYEAYAAARTYNVRIPGCQDGRLFAGQRKDPFVVNLGEVFDLVNVTNPLGPVDAEADDLVDKNVTSLILEVPIACLTSNRTPVIGAWTTASLPRDGSNGLDEWIQASRLGAPLVNEVVIGLKDKDRFNASEPKFDAQFASYVTNPTLPAILEILFGGAGVKAPTLFPRADLVAAFLTGVPGLNANGSVAEMLRLNTSTAPKPAAAQSNLGVIGGDVAGFPNGRRPGDDVVDIELRVAMGKLLPAANAPSGQLPFTDGALVDASHFSSTFPYLRTPLPGSPNGTP